MPKAKPTQVIVHRIELQEKEREYLETLQTTQSYKNMAIAGTAVAASTLGYLGYKGWMKWRLDEEASILDILSKQGRADFLKRAEEEGNWTALKEVFFDPFNLRSAFF